MKTRRAKYFVGADAVYADLEDLFLNMEGVANWAGYRLASRESASLPDAVAFMRRGGKHWSQDEGLALFLVIDAAVPAWQAHDMSPYGSLNLTSPTTDALRMSPKTCC